MIADGDVFWGWATQAYARPGAQALLLDLQDAHGQSVPFLLWAAWMQASGREPARQVLAEGADLARRWETDVVGPLRGVRRHLADADAGADALRRQVAATELEAERRLMHALAALSPSATSAGAADVFHAAASHWTPPPPADALKLLARVLG